MGGIKQNNSKKKITDEPKSCIASMHRSKVTRALHRPKTGIERIRARIHMKDLLKASAKNRGINKINAHKILY